MVLESIRPFWHGLCYTLKQNLKHIDTLDYEDKPMKLLHREIQLRRATQRLLQRKNVPNKKRIAQLTAEIFELQRIILTKAQAQGMLHAA